LKNQITACNEQSLSALNLSDKGITAVP